MSLLLKVPLVLWGSGVRHPSSSSSSSSSLHPLDSVHREDVAQADLAPLMAALIGTAVPKNNVGKLHANFLRMPPAQVNVLIYSKT